MGKQVALKKKYTGKKIRLANKRFGELLEQGRYDECARLGMLAGIVSAGSKRMFRALRHGSRVYAWIHDPI